MKTRAIIILTLILCFFTILSGCNVGFSFEKPNVDNYIYFGKYDGKPIGWDVLISGDDLLLINCGTITSRAFDSEGRPWAQSDLKSWLNTDFLNEFDSRELAAIKTETDGTIARILTVGEAYAYAGILAWSESYSWLSDEGIDPDFAACLNFDLDPSKVDVDGKKRLSHWAYNPLSASIRQKYI